MTDSIPKINYPELFFGFVAPIGADLRPALAAFRSYLTARNYKVVEIKTTDFFQISIYSRRGARVDYLSRRFASSLNRADAHRYRHLAEELIDLDEHEVGERHGQRVASIFHDADIIISSDAVATVEQQVRRFC